MGQTSIVLASTMERIQGETLEAKIRRIKNNGTGVEEGLNMIYSEKGTGVDPLTNPRTDLMELALNKIDEKVRSRILAQENRQKEALEKPKDADTKNTGTEPGGKSPEASQ